jgi:lipid-binding SYLF domain-containing protein
MRKYFSMFIAAVASFIFLAPVNAQQSAVSNETAKVEAASSVLAEIMRVPEDGIPEALLSNAYGVAVIPGVIKAAFGIGGRYGEGILAVRTADGAWSNPAFISLTGGSLGWQIGAESTDLILVFKSRQSIDAISRGKFTLGVDASVAAGPVGRHAQASTDAQLRAEIYSYSRSRGLFAGVALEGAALQMDNSANAVFYDRPDITANMIFAGKGLLAPQAATRFTCALAAYTNTSMKMCA